MTCPLCGEKTEITRGPTAEESRALLSLKRHGRTIIAELRAEKHREEGTPHLTFSEGRTA